MTIVTISRGTFSKGKEIAEQVAQRLGYDCISREILLETSEQFGLPELKLARAIHDAPTLLERLGHRKESYVTFFRIALLKRLQRDDTVYHGLAGHFFLGGLPHVLKVRINADMQERIQLETERTGICADEARDILERDDEQRRSWSRHLYGIDTHDPSLYDLVIHLGAIRVDDAVEIIVHAARLDRFSSTPASRSMMDACLLDAEVRAALVDVSADLEPFIEDGIVHVRSKVGNDPGEAVQARTRRALERLPGVREVRFDALEESYTNPWHKI